MNTDLSNILPVQTATLPDPLGENESGLDLGLLTEGDPLIFPPDDAPNAISVCDLGEVPDLSCLFSSDSALTGQISKGESAGGSGSALFSPNGEIGSTTQDGTSVDVQFTVVFFFTDLANGGTTSFSPSNGPTSFADFVGPDGDAGPDGIPDLFQGF